MEKIKTVDASEFNAKRSYSTPELLELGEVGKLTLGSGTQHDDGDNTSTN